LYWPEKLFSKNHLELRNLPMYRYLDRKWVELFRNEGTLRVQNIAKYRAIGDVREDNTEGIVTSVIQGTGVLTREQAKEALGVDVRSIIFKPGWKGRIKHNLHLPNGYMVCVSAMLGSHLLKRFGVDDYFTITNVDLFRDSLARAIGDRIRLEITAFDRVVYVSQKELSFTVAQLSTPGGIRRAHLSDFFRKASSYAIEAEYRFIFLTDEQDVPEFLDVQLTQAEIFGCCMFN
jgi:hypothetical protein